MSFFQTADGEQIESKKEFDGGGGNIDPIPSGAVVLAAPSEVKWDTFEGSGEDYISITWTVMLPEEYKNRKIFQKLQVNDTDINTGKASKKSDKAKRMLVAIDANAGGKLMAAGEEPTDESLQLALTNKAMSLSVETWEIKEDRDTGEALPEDQWKRGNWVRAVADKGAAKAAAAAVKAEGKPAPQPRQASASAPAAKPAANGRPVNAQRTAAAAKPQQSAPQQPAPDFDSFEDDIPFAPIGLQEGRMFLHMI